MATRCRIAFKEADGPWRSIYVHNDGYPESFGVGYHLKESYQSVEKARDLIALGDISSLEKSLERTIAYHRDMGEDAAMTRPATHEYEASVYSRAYETSAAYLYLKDGEQPWQCFKYAGEAKWLIVK